MKWLKPTALFFCLLVGLQAMAYAQSTPDNLSEELIETRAREIGQSLRCVVCQNQSIEESDASLAEDMRRLVRARVRAGESNEDVINFMQDRYGDFVLLKPPVQANTYVLWGAPFIIVLLGIVWFLRQARRPDTNLVAPLSDDEITRLKSLDSDD